MRAGSLALSVSTIVSLNLMHILYFLRKSASIQSLGVSHNVYKMVLRVTLFYMYISFLEQLSTKMMGSFVMN